MSVCKYTKMHAMCVSAVKNIQVSLWKITNDVYTHNVAYNSSIFLFSFFFLFLVNTVAWQKKRIYEKN